MNKGINRYEFNKILKTIPNISPKERGYLNRVFNKDLIRGLSAFELKQKISQLRFNKEDELDQWELKAVKGKLLKRIGN